MRILGLSAFYHDSAAALIEDGAIIAAFFPSPFERAAILTPVVSVSTISPFLYSLF